MGKKNTRTEFFDSKKSEILILRKGEGCVVKGRLEGSGKGEWKEELG